jgi:hypothetical protein
MTYMAGGKQYVAIPVGASLIGDRVIRVIVVESGVSAKPQFIVPASDAIAFSISTPDSTGLEIISTASEGATMRAWSTYL